MKLEEFQVGLTFYTGSGAWICTDVGKRVIIAALASDLAEYPKGPPYSIAESNFDEYDQQGCSLDPDEFDPKHDAATWAATAGRRRLAESMVGPIRDLRTRGRLEREQGLRPVEQIPSFEIEKVKPLDELTAADIPRGLEPEDVAMDED